MKFLEVAKEGNKIRRSGWFLNSYLEIKDNLVWYTNGKNY